MRFIEQTVLNEWKNLGAIVSHDSLSMVFSEILESLPWMAGHIDFSQLNLISASLRSLSDDYGDLESEKVKKWITTAGAVEGEHIAFWYSQKQPCVICSADFALKNIDTAYWGIPGWNYMFWCSQNNGVIVPNYKNILCYDSADQLVLVTTE